MSASMVERVTREECPVNVVALSALGLDGTDTGIIYSAAVLGHEKVLRFLDLAARSGLVVFDCHEIPAGNCDCFRILDLLDADGMIIEDFHVPTEAQWAALNSELRLRVIHPCQTCGWEHSGGC